MIEAIVPFIHPVVRVEVPEFEPTPEPDLAVPYDEPLVWEEWGCVFEPEVC